MQYKTFKLNAYDSMAEEELNRFLRSRRIQKVEKHFVADGEDSFWSFCVSYLDGPEKGDSRAPKVDYREILPPDEFAVFSKLRDRRKEVAEKEGVPPYTVFTNEQLARMVQEKVRDLADVQKLPGIGAARLEKYAEPILEVLREALPE